MVSIADIPDIPRPSSPTLIFRGAYNYILYLSGCYGYLEYNSDIHGYMHVARLPNSQIYNFNDSLEKLVLSVPTEPNCIMHTDRVSGFL